jgi:cytochrome subunit of sulfide dehydrogenase
MRTLIQHPPLFCAAAFMFSGLVFAQATTNPPPPAVAPAPSAVPAAVAAPPPIPFAPSNLTPSGVRALAANCAACHGTNGKSAAGSVVPGLAGRDAEYFVTQMANFKSGTRQATLMHQISKGYTDAEIKALADYFAAQKP